MALLNQQLQVLFKTRVQQYGLRALSTNATNYAKAAPDKDVSTVLEQVHIDEAVKLNPTLASIPTELWYRTHETLVNHGLYTVNFLRIVNGNPAILTRSPKQIIGSLELWRCCQFGENFMHLLITKYPEMLDVSDGQRLLKHTTFLRSLVETNKNVWKLLMSCPDLMSQSEKCITEKFNYCTEVMRLQVPEIVKSEALSKPIEEIRCRHVFLERLGLFKPRSIRSNPNEPTKNHRLYQITDTSDKTFATKVCHVTLPEFEAFQELYKRERQRLQDEEDTDNEEA